MSLKDVINTKVVNFSRRIHKRLFVSKLKHTRSFTLQSSEILTVSILCSHSTTDLAIASLKSLYRFLEFLFPLNIHDDGTLTELDVEKFRTSFHGVRIITRSEADKEITSFLEIEGLTNTLKFRQAHNLYLKATDFNFFCMSKYCLQIDSDILFYKMPYFLKDDFLNQIIQTSSSLYNQDRGQAYCYDDDELINLTKKTIPFRFNSGLILFPKIQEAASFINYILSFNLVVNNPWTLEQTLVALILQKYTTCKPFENNFDVALNILENPTIDYNYNLISSQHYCAWSRNLFYIDFVEKVYPFIKYDSPFRTYYHRKLKS